MSGTTSATASAPVRVLGVTVYDQTAQPEKAQGLKALYDGFDSARRATHEAIRSDVDRKRKYNFQSSNLLSVGAFSTSASVSLLNDCGLPNIYRFADFIKLFTQALSPEAFPFVGTGAQRNSSLALLNTLWEPSVNPVFQFFLDLFDNKSDLQLYSEHLNYLTRLSKDDSIWNNPSTNAGDWFDTFASLLEGYLLDLFTDRFVDRSGTHVAFNLKSDVTSLASLDLKQVSPQLAGSIVSTFCEFLGDALFQVPFYSSDILSLYRSTSKNKSDNTKLTSDLRKAQEALIKAMGKGLLDVDSIPFVGVINPAISRL